jgi:SPP1 gp7 family putative phage head morphogenesis protein
MASADPVNQVIQFRIDTTADKFTNDLMDTVKYQLSSDLGSSLALNDVLDRTKVTIGNFVTDFKLSNIAETEIGFILGKAFEDYLKDNLKAVLAGTLSENMRIERVMYSAIMDKKVCELCEKLDGTVVDVDSFIRKKYDPPLHYMCRCAWLPITQADIDSTDIAGTDLTLGKKGKPLSADELTQMLGDALNLKLFTDHILYLPR